MKSHVFYIKKHLWLFILATLLWLIGNFFENDDFYLLRITNYFIPWIILFSYLHGLLALYLRLYTQACFIIIFSFILSCPYIKLFLPRNLENNNPKSFTIKVMSFSVMGRNKAIESMANVIINSQADIIFLQEVSQPEALQKNIAGLYGKKEPVYFIKDCLPIISRFPLNEVKCSGDVNYATTKVFGRTVHLWNIHATKSIYGEKSYRLQKKSVTRVLEQTQHFIDSPIIIAGDFNATENSQVYRDINFHFNNAHYESGFGFGFTFPSPARRIGFLFPFVRIDHIFYNENFEALNTLVLKETGGSDHYPILATLLLHN